MPYFRRLPSGKWRVELRDPAGRRFGGTFPTKGAARAWAEEEATKVRRGRFVDPRQAQRPFSELVERWWAGRVTEASTAATDRGRVERHILPKWESWPLEAITPSALQQWVKALSASNLSAWTVRSIVNLTSSALDSARIDGLIATNPARDVQLPTRPPGKEVFLTRSEVAAVAEAMSRRPGAAKFDAAVVWSLALTGLRWSELCGLRRRQLDPLLRHLEVTGVTVQVNGAFTDKPYGKTARRRQVPIPVQLREVLAAHLARHPAEQGDRVFRPVLLGHRWGRSEALCRHNWPRVAFKPAIQAALGRDDVTPHDLRRSYGSWLAQAGLSLHEIGQLLGHGSAETTKIYARFVPGQFDRALAALDLPAVPFRVLP